VVAGGGDLEGPSRTGLAAHIRQIGVRGRRCGRRGRDRGRRSLAPQHVDGMHERFGRQHVDAAG
jgi:hypothetical protein